MEAKRIRFSLLAGILISQLCKVNCNKDNNAFLSTQFERVSITNHDTINHLLPLYPNMSFHKNIHNLPENAIYCTKIIKSNSVKYEFLEKYYAAIQGKSAAYTSTLKCIYPKSLEPPDFGDEKPFKAITKFQEALLDDTKKFREFLDKLDKGEKPEPYKPLDVQPFADEIMSDIFHRKPNPSDSLQKSAPNGVICEHLMFTEANSEGILVEVERPVCYPAQRPPIPVTSIATQTTKYPIVANTVKRKDSKLLDNACYFLCYTGLIYQLLPCCKDK